MNKLIQFKSLEELPIIADLLIENFYPNKGFAFFGSMGTGKTTLIKAICDKLQVQDVVGSPTFAIINEYFSKKNGTIFHFDFYRLKSIDEALDLGLDEYFYSNYYCFIEWPEKILNLLPENFISLKIEEKNGERSIYTL